jgi:anti-sigma-K factor RskA
VDIKAYIESGAIEAYVLGLASAEETAELQLLRAQYAEVNRAIIAFEEQLENAAMAEAEMPPAFIKQRLNASLAGEFKANGNGKVAEMKQSSAIKPFWKYVAAASVILLMGSATLNFYLYNRYQTADNRYTKLLAQQTTLIAGNNVMTTKLNAMDEALKIITDPLMKPVSMPSAKAGENFRATVYWDTKTNDVYLLNNNLPKAPQGKQYQLWALVNGKPVDAGMMNCQGICRMKNITKADSFAITLEDESGSPAPHLENLYVIGKT